MNIKPSARYMMAGVIFTLALGLSACKEDGIDSQEEAIPTLETDAEPTYHVAATSPEAISFNIAANVPWSITSEFSSEDRWLKVSPSKSAVSSLSEKVTVDINDNPDMEDRTATLTITAENIDSPTKIIITQKARDGIIVSAPASTAFTAKGGEISFTVTANQAWTATSSAAWLQLAPASGEGSNSAVTVTASADANDGMIRSASVTIKSTDGSISCAPINFSQEGAPVKLAFEETSDIEYGYKGGSKNFKIVSETEGVTPASVEWTVVASDGLGTVSKDISGEGFTYELPSSPFAGMKNITLSLVSGGETIATMTVKQQSWLYNASGNDCVSEPGDGTLIIKPNSTTPGHQSTVKARENLPLNATIEISFSKVDIQKGYIYLEMWDSRQIQFFIGGNGNKVVWMNGGLNWGQCVFNDGMPALADIKNFKYTLPDKLQDGKQISVSVNGTQLGTGTFWQSSSPSSDPLPFLIGMRANADNEPVEGELVISGFTYTPTL